MLLSYLSFLLTLSIITAVPTPEWEHTPAERMRLLGPFADSRVEFPCKTLAPSATVPTSPHNVRVADIKFIGSIGDSLTAANGAKAFTIIALLVEYRGISWCIGGDSNLDSVITLANIMRKFNPSLRGFSTGTGNQNASNANFNLAKPGAVSNDMPGQARLLVSRMKAALGAQFDTEWKMITFFIGGNDLCDSCKANTIYTATNFEYNVKMTIEILRDNMPYTIINYVTVLNVAELEDLHEGATCQTMQSFLCDCAINPATREIVRAHNLAYQAATNRLFSDMSWCDRPTFVVIVQPFMEHMKVPTKPNGATDFTYFAPDCFHFSQKGHEAAAVELWNNLMEPVGQKTTTWNLQDTLHCPHDDHGYIYTHKNSHL